jgi:hypothetical protein
MTDWAASGRNAWAEGRSGRGTSALKERDWPPEGRQKARFAGAGVSSVCGRLSAGLIAVVVMLGVGLEVDFAEEDFGTV